MSGPSFSTKPWVVLVGGFLGAGKTTLILAAARELQRRGLRNSFRQFQRVGRANYLHGAGYGAHTRSRYRDCYFCQ